MSELAPLAAAPRLVRAPAAVAAPVPPCATEIGVRSPRSDVMSALAPLAAAPRLVRAPPAVADPVPPFATGTTPVSEMFGVVPPLEASGAEAVTAVTLGASGPSSGGG